MTPAWTTLPNLRWISSFCEGAGTLFFTFVRGDATRDMFGKDTFIFSCYVLGNHVSRGVHYSIFQLMGMQNTSLIARPPPNIHSNVTKWEAQVFSGPAR